MANITAFVGKMQASDEHHLASGGEVADTGDMSKSILIGDNLSDIEAGCAAGVGIQILLSSQDGHPYVQETWCYQAKSLDEIRCRFFPNINRLTPGLSSQSRVVS